MLIADEPVSALDASAQATIVTLLGELRDETGIGILFISHDLGVVRQIAQKVAVMYLGKIVEIGAIDAVWRRPCHPYTEALIAAAPLAGSLTWAWLRAAAWFLTCPAVAA